VWLNARNEQLALGRVADIQHFLDNVVRVLVLHHDLQWSHAGVAILFVENLVDKHLSVLIRTILNTLLDDIAVLRGVSI